MISPASLGFVPDKNCPGAWIKSQPSVKKHVKVLENKLLESEEKAAALEKRLAKLELLLQDVMTKSSDTL